MKRGAYMRTGHSLAETPVYVQHHQHNLSTWKLWHLETFSRSLWDWPALP